MRQYCGTGPGEKAFTPWNDCGTAGRASSYHVFEQKWLPYREAGCREGMFPPWVSLVTIGLPRGNEERKGQGRFGPARLFVDAQDETPLLKVKG